MKKWSIITIFLLCLTIGVTSQFQQQPEAYATEQLTVEHNAILNEAPPVITAGLIPKINHSYTYEPSFKGPERVTYKASANSAITNSVELLESDFIGFTYIEQNGQLKLGTAYSDVFYFALNYPMIENNVTTDTLHDATTVAVTSTTTTLTTPAGTFHNVVVLTYPNGSTLYFAKDYGIIRITDFEGMITTELIAVN